MSEETRYESTEPRTRSDVASYLRRVAAALDGGGPVPVAEDGTVTVDPSETVELDIEVEREPPVTELEVELEWHESEATIERQQAADTAESASAGTFELYRDSAGEWRWRLRHQNGNIIADSGEGYTSKANAKNGIESVKTNAPGASVDEQS